MAEPLKNHYGPEIPRMIAAMVAAVYPRFDREAFLRDALRGYDTLELMDRGRKIATALRIHLPDNYPEAVRILVASAKVPVERAGHAMDSFLFMPHLFYVQTHGLAAFEESMAAQYELTQKFTAEFSIRPFLERYPAETLQRLKIWARDPNVHVRRLVSEGTRPRLPWAPRLRQFQKDPAPVLQLLDMLKDDPEPYVRRSVANNLNDIGKDHPDILVETARRWMKDAADDRRRLIRHALRSAVKRGDPGALAILGFESVVKATLCNVLITPARVETENSVTFSFDLVSTASRRQRVLVDFCIHFVKSNGTTNPKVFKLKTVDMNPLETISLKKTVSLLERTTRKHYPGTHRIDLLLNGRETRLGEFELVRRPTQPPFRPVQD